MIARKTLEEIFAELASEPVRGFRAFIAADGSKKFAWRLVNAAVDEAITKFGGSATDRAIWAKIAWRVEADAFVDAIFQSESELAEKRKRVPNEQLPRFFQSVLNRRFPKWE